MRTTKDRIRHTLGFEILGLVLLVTLISWLFGFDMHAIGPIAVFGSIIATVWNYFYNLLFDHFMLKVRGDTYKTIPMRVLHAFVFEGGLLLLFLPMIAWYLGISLWQAFIMDITMAIFYLVHAFIYNWGYDKVFPVQENPSRIKTAML